MIEGDPKYRLMQRALDEVGITTCIIKLSLDKYQWIVNYEVLAEFRQRRSCNNRLVKLYNEKCLAEDNGNNQA